eukprot:TRINITY_DN4280_c1_g1_i1.p1 TRINITY_DN4280_c1_g1~~TRINITY_DN4280_c1_g1_i1.p1  ORF type:complete len:876 (+),score=147.64 TRINITY_DN4280_c1_g1_i1:1451-4078(+)
MKRKKKPWLRNGPVEAGPDWIGDEQAAACMMCLVNFTTLTRRHHCRNCGHIFCGQCAGHWHPIPDLDYRNEVRVCKMCKDELLHSQTEAVFHKLSDVPIANPPFELQLFNNERLRSINTCSLLSNGKKRVLAVVDQYLILANPMGGVKKVFDLDTVEKIYQQRVMIKRKYHAAEDIKPRMNLLVKFPDCELCCAIHPFSKDSDFGNLFIGTVQKINEALTGTSIAALQVNDDCSLQEFSSDPTKQNVIDRNSEYYNREFSNVVEQLLLNHGVTSIFATSRLERILREAKNRPKELLNKVRERGRSRQENEDPVHHALRMLLTTYEPIRLKTLPSLLSRHVGLEEELLEDLKQEYIPELSVKRQIEDLLKLEGLDTDTIQQILSENKQHEQDLLARLKGEQRERPKRAETKINHNEQDHHEEEMSEESIVYDDSEEEAEKVDVQCARCKNLISEHTGGTGFTWQGRAALLFTKPLRQRSTRSGQRTRQQCSSGAADTVLLTCRKCGVEIGARFVRYRGNTDREGCSICYADALQTDFPVETSSSSNSHLTKTDLSFISETPFGTDILKWFLEHKKDEVLAVPSLLRSHAGWEEKLLTGLKKTDEDNETDPTHRVLCCFGNHTFTADSDNNVAYNGEKPQKIAVEKLCKTARETILQIDSTTIVLPQGRELEITLKVCTEEQWWFPCVVRLMECRYWKWTRWVETVKNDRKPKPVPRQEGTSSSTLRSVLKPAKLIKEEEEEEPVKEEAKPFSKREKPNKKEKDRCVFTDPALCVKHFTFDMKKGAKKRFSKPVPNIFPKHRSSFTLPEPVLAYPQALIAQPPFVSSPRNSDTDSTFPGSPVTPYWRPAADTLQKNSLADMPQSPKPLWEKPMHELL